MQGTSGRLAKKHLHCLKSEHAMSLIHCDSGGGDDDDDDDDVE